MQGYLAFVHRQATGNFSPAEPAGTAYFHSSCAGLHSAEQGLLHSPPESNAAFYLFGYLLRYQISIQFRALNFLDIQLDLLTDKVFKVGSRFVHPLAASADNDTRPGGIDGNRDLVRLPLDFNLGNSGFSIPFLNTPTEYQILL